MLEMKTPAGMLAVLSFKDEYMALLASLRLAGRAKAPVPTQASHPHVSF
jgi:hypothetical protein